MTATAPGALPPLLENGGRPRGLISRMRDVWAYRELLGNLVRRELKVKYKDSVLGFVWTLLNPLLYLAIFSIVFAVVLPTRVPRYGLFLLTGLLVWNVFAIGLATATTSIVSNGALVQKVWFPREVLPLAAVGAAVINFFFQLIVLLAGMLVFGQVPAWGMLWLVVPALLIAILLSSGLGLMLAGLNVRYRDVGHFLELGLLAWFWLTPIVFQYDFVGKAVIDRFGIERLTLLNPMLPVVTTFQRVVYNPENFSEADRAEYFELLMRPTSFFVINLAVSGAAALILCYVGLRTFTRLEENLGEEL